MTEIANSPDMPSSPEGILGLAQRIYDEHVSEGENIKNRLINDAEVEAERLLFEARAEAETLRVEAEEYHLNVIANADQEVKELIESSADRVAAIHDNIASLQQFEASYRLELRKLIESTTALLDATEARGIEPLAEESTEETADEEASEEETADEVVNPSYDTYKVYDTNYDEDVVNSVNPDYDDTESNVLEEDETAGEDTEEEEEPSKRIFTI